MVRKSYALMLILALALVLAGIAKPSYAAINYNVSAQPGTVNLVAQNTTITVTVLGGAANTQYDLRVTVTKPGGPMVGQSSVVLTVRTDPAGDGSAAARYPNNTPAWTTISGTPANTDVQGTYSISVDKLSPNPVQNGVATGAFTVVPTLSVVILSPADQSSTTRGGSVTITASVAYVDGTPVTTGTITSTTPGSFVSLSASGTPGVYTKQYQLPLNDILGGWNLNVTATQGANRGSGQISLTVQPAVLVITDMATYNAYSVPTSDFSPGDTLYATYRIQYSPAGGFLATGSYNILVKNPSGATVGTLLTIYDPNRGVFYTPSGFPISSSDTSGSWQLTFQTNSITDANNNVGPVAPVTQRFQVRQSQVIISQFYFILAGAALSGGLSTFVFLKRFNTKRVPFDNLFQLTGGEIKAPASLLIIGDAGAGSSTLAFQLLHRDLTAGKQCGLLSYDGFPSEVKRKMRDMGWDIVPYLETGQLTILDCYSALAGVEGAPIQDPTDFTEVSIQVTGMIEKAKKKPCTIVFDSVTPIFNSASAKDCINFLQVLGAKVKNSGGMFILTATRGSIPEEARSKIESLADGVIELSLAKKSRSLSRSLQVKKLSGGHTDSAETGFEIESGKGIVLKRKRIPIGLFQPK